MVMKVKVMAESLMRLSEYLEHRQQEATVEEEMVKVVLVVTDQLRFRAVIATREAIDDEEDD